MTGVGGRAVVRHLCRMVRRIPTLVYHHTPPRSSPSHQGIFAPLPRPIPCRVGCSGFVSPSRGNRSWGWINMPKNKYALPDELWEKIQPLIPARENPHPRGGGRKPKDDRVVFDAILFVLRFGCQWNALNATGLCPSSTVHDRFRKWVKAGVFHRMWAEGLLEHAILCGINWSWLTVDESASAALLAREKRRRKPVRPWQERRRREPAVACEEPLAAALSPA